MAMRPCFDLVWDVEGCGVCRADTLECTLSSQVARSFWRLGSLPRLHKPRRSLARREGAVVPLERLRRLVEKSGVATGWGSASGERDGNWSLLGMKLLLIYNVRPFSRVLIPLALLFLLDREGHALACCVRSLHWSRL